MFIIGWYPRFVSWEAKHKKIIGKSMQYDGVRKPIWQEATIWLSANSDGVVQVELWNRIIFWFIDDFSSERSLVNLILFKSSFIGLTYHLTVHWKFAIEFIKATSYLQNCLP